MSPKRPLWCKTDSPCAVNRSVARVESRTILYAVYFHSRYMEIAIDDRNKVTRNLSWEAIRYHSAMDWRLRDSHGSPSLKNKNASKVPVPLSHLRANFAAARTNNCIRDCTSSREVPGRTCRRCDSVGARREEGTKKLTCRVDGARDRARKRGKKERDIYKRTVESTWVLARWGARGNLRCAANVSLPGKRSPLSYRILNELPAWPREILVRASVSRWRLVIEIRCLGSRADRKSREQTLLSRTVRNLHRYIVRARVPARARDASARIRRFERKTFTVP